ncbi:geranylgeranyl reductase family protein [Pseudodesulfovibrio sp. zrk46]|uniref:NAD(P)/FAD-dependent oxidoreductase n=1 Tax=Pseudodesulfovibrio sp. zrk46 TaxID=2725288 RepID=UPI001449B1C6|nr:geranylgeranyl reductase family protein [Pseudodesulfovibrio sp. zrk46]QJB55759.1 geranylgeranyl reductase family protein [Pseudodesulfovibrio sp. zrk46]
MKQYDVIICGGGPAGATAGTILAAKGHSVAILDKATFPRKKLCGGLLTWKSVKLLETAFGETPESLTDAGVINYASDQFSIRTYESSIANGGLPYPFHFVDRTPFDARLLENARNSGCDTFEDVKVEQVDTLSGVVKTSCEKEFHGKYILGADGANSVVRRAFPNYNRDRFKNFMAPALEISFPLDHFPRAVLHPELVIGFMDAGYGWVFPNQDRVVVGICGLRQEKVNFSDLFREYLEFLEIEQLHIPEFHGHPLPYGNYLENPVHGRALLAGDAGGFVEPLFGEGIFFALCSGYYAGHALAEALTKRTEPGPIYSSRMHTHLIPEIKASDRLRWVLFKSMSSAGPKSIDLFVNSLTTPLAEMVHGIRSYRWLRKKEWDF